MYAFMENELHTHMERYLKISNANSYNPKAFVRATRQLFEWRKTHCASEDIHFSEEKCALCKILKESSW